MFLSRCRFRVLRAAALVLTDIEAGDVGVMLRGDEGWRMMERRRVLGNVRTLKRSKGR